MHKKIETDLISLAKQISKMESGGDVTHFQDKARMLYEKLTVLSVVNKYFLETEKEVNTETSVTSTKEAVSENPIVAVPIPVVQKTLDKTIKSTTEPITDKEKTTQLVDQTVQTIKQEATDIVNKIQNQKPQEIIQNPSIKQTTMEQEMKDSIPADVAANMFQKATNLEKDMLTKKAEIPKANIATKQTIPNTPKPSVPKPTVGASINDSVHRQKLQIGLNDRIAFVKHLFNFSQEDFNRVLSQLNSFESEQECKDFLYNAVKPEYDWSTHEEYEARLIDLIERKFL